MRFLGRVVWLPLLLFLRLGALLRMVDATDAEQTGGAPCCGQNSLALEFIEDAQAATQEALDFIENGKCLMICSSIWVLSSESYTLQCHSKIAQVN